MNMQNAWNALTKHTTNTSRNVMKLLKKSKAGSDNKRNN